MAARLLLSGDVVGGDEALALRLVGAVEPDAASCVAHAERLAGRIASRAGPAAVQTCVTTLRRAQDAGLAAALQREAAAQALCYATADYVEGLEAVIAKRPPGFLGK